MTERFSEVGLPLVLGNQAGSEKTAHEGGHGGDMRTEGHILKRERPWGAERREDRSQTPGLGQRRNLISAVRREESRGRRVQGQESPGAGEAMRKAERHQERPSSRVHWETGLLPDSRRTLMT